MAANMQHMANANPMMQQMQAHQNMRKNGAHYQQTIYARLSATPMPAMGWQTTLSMNDRMGKTMELFTNVVLGTPSEPLRSIDLCITYEQQAYLTATSKESYDTMMNSKISEFFKKREENGTNLQNGLNANANAQAQAQAQAQQAQRAQAMANMNMQSMGRGFGPPQAFSGMVQGMPGQPGQQMSNQQQHHQMLQLQQQQQMAASMGLPNQAGRGMAPGQHPGMPGGAPGQARPSIMAELARLPPGDREKVNQLALRMLSQATEQTKNMIRAQLGKRMPDQQHGELAAGPRDPALIYYLSQAFTALRNNSLRNQQGAANVNPQQAAMMQQQNSQQRANNRFGNAQGAVAGHDFSQFGPSMESIKDQQMSGLMAQQAGQMVVPASGAARNATPQPGNQGMASQQPQNQTPRPGQQAGQQPQMKLNQASQQVQAAQMKQMQSQQGSVTGGMDQNQTPGMNVAANRGPNSMNPMGTPAGQHVNAAFGDQRFNPQAVQQRNQMIYSAMMASMNDEQRQQISGFSQEKVLELMRRWTAQHQQLRNSNTGQLQHQQNQMAQSMPGVVPQQPMQPLPMQQQQPPPQPMQQQQQQSQQQQQQQQQQPQTRPNNAPNLPNQQGSGPMNLTNAQAQTFMDTLDVPPPVRNSLLPQLPPEIKKWRDLRMWVGQNNILPQIKVQLSNLQRNQFQHCLAQRRMNQLNGQQPGQIPQPQQQLQPGHLQQHGQQQSQHGQQGQQNIGMNPMMNTSVTMPSVPPNMANLPPHLSQATPQEIMQIRNRHPAFAGQNDDQLRAAVIAMKQSSYLKAQNARRAQAANNQSLGPQNSMAGQASGQMVPQQQQQQQASRTTGQQSQPPPQTIPMHSAAPNQAPPPPRQQPTPQQPAKNLKRPSTDDSAEGSASAGSNAVAAMNAGGGARPNMPRKLPLTPQQISTLTPEQKQKYEMFLKAQMASKDSSAASIAPSAESITKLRAIGQDVSRQFAHEQMIDIPMSQQELGETAEKLKRIVVDMGKVGRGLSKWFAITGDESRASMFFKFRLRLVKQFLDGEEMKVMRDSFSMRSSDLEQARAMLESMARDIHASVNRGLLKAQNSQQQQGQKSQQTPQGSKEQFSGTVAPLNATNLERNSQALNRQQKNASKSANQPPPAPTVAQAPGFPTNASSPHGNPSYMNKAKDMNLQIPPRKKQKMGQQPGQAANTPSPRVSKTASPEVKRAPEPPKPVFLCKETDCDVPSIGFPTEQALKQHVEEEHIKPREDPVKFVLENLALALGLEMDGTVKKTTAGDGTAQAMSASGSKQGQDGAMKRSGSALSRMQSAAGRGENGTPRTGADEAATPGSSDPWATSTLDTQALLSNLGFENGLPTVMNEYQLYGSATPNDTPESSKDSGASEPNSDISDGAALEIEMNWQNVDTDLLLNLDNTKLGTAGTMDPSVLLDPLAGPPPDWDDMDVDFNKSFQFDTSRYFFDTSS